MIENFNATIGSNNRGYEHIMGEYRVRQMNDNGGRITSLCALSHLIIRGSVFQHKTIHKATWVSHG